MNNRYGILLLIAVCVTAYGCAKSEHVEDKTWKDNFDSGFSAMQSRDYATAETSYRDALDSAKAFPKGDLRLAKTYDALGEAYIAENKIEDAKRAYTNGYNEYKSLWKAKGGGVDNRDYALGLASDALHLANIACDALRLDEAEHLFDEALSVEESALGSDDLKGQILEGKSKLYRLTGRNAEAEKIKQQIAELKALPSVDDTGNMTWKELNVAGTEAFQAGNLAKAEKIFTAGIARAKKPVQIAESMRGLARIYDQQKEFVKAIAKLEEARRVLRADEHRLELADNLNLTGFCYFRAKDYANAEKMFLDSIKVLNLKQHNDAERGKTAYEGLTQAYGEEGKDAEAEKYAQEKVALTLQLYGKEDGRYAEDLLAVATLQAKQKKIEEATKGYLAVIALEESNPSPRCMLAALDSYAKLLRETNKPALADTIELKAKNLRAEFE
ncbi:MAG: tetratricopeptide repeat protein [Cyanobacteria bacterium SZAS-4]|nr:tetratricopeptide repeat protein [Cyanobacteria bacterium SZAS-4]